MNEASRVKMKRHSYRCKCLDEGEVRFNVYLPADTDQNDIDGIECPLCRQDIFLSHVGTSDADTSEGVGVRYRFVLLLLILFSGALGVPALLAYGLLYGIRPSTQAQCGAPR